MKLQYLGDSRDSFKWDYHDYLTATLGYPILNVVLMMTPDDDTNNGATAPEVFPARQVVINFCRELRNQRDIQLIKQLPSRTGAMYKVELHKGATQLTNTNRREYFTNISSENRQVLFLDPDNGFEPEKSNNEKHVLYSDIEAILEQVSAETVVSVFQYFRRIPFDKDFVCIKQNIMHGYATAIYWHSLMFVVISKAKETIAKVLSVNQQYSQNYPVNILDI